MPQMAPISWIILFFIFSSAFLLFNILNYYCFNYTKNNSLNKTNDNNNQNKNINYLKINWKW